MFYQLPNGRVFEISTELYFDISDEDLEYLVAYNYGEILENPWYGSVLVYRSIETVEDLSDDALIDLTNADDMEKLIDLDVDIEDLNQ
jgi:hypothetical protein